MKDERKEEQPLYLNPDADVEARIQDLLKRMTLEEKIRIMSGRRMFEVKPVKRLGIPPMKTTDGPHGVAPHSSGFRKATYFPVAKCLASTWNPDLAFKFGAALAEETRASGKHMILAPGINIDRTPMNGRTFEYFTEDPFLNSRLAVAVVKGIQSRRIAPCVKHYVCNNQETDRMTISAEVSRRALEEIYFPAFKACAIEGKAMAYMACYNKVNGYHGCENKEILEDTLFGKWHMQGCVVSDWFASRKTRSTEACLRAGLSLEMPKAIKYKKSAVIKAIKEGKIREERIDELVTRLLRVMFFVGLFDPPDRIPAGAKNTPEHFELARKIAEEGMVLLKNENILPIKIDEIDSIAVLGPNRNKILSMLGGSSEVRSVYGITPLKGIKKRLKGTSVKIIKDPLKADHVIYVGGLNHKPHNDCEGFDRRSYSLPEKQIREILELAMINNNLTVVLVSGSPVGMTEWIDKVPAIIQAWYAGLEAGTALASILFGDVNPSGKLPITFPKRLEDSPAHKSKRTFPGVDGKVYYEEGIYIGYRYFDTEGIKPMFRFGHGLSYTQFEYSDPAISGKITEDGGRIKITVKVSNVGERDGKETVQLYLRDNESSVDRPFKELKGFDKVFIEAGKSREITFDLGIDDLKFFDENKNEWVAEPGEFTVFIGPSSGELPITLSFDF